ncbi:hypothetical protein CEP54_001804 [Fusarium duplospermum]|uniref:Uncharacterized protein n=1 Tax=Fusarium duplospermum TaxID=1325734 RepID=A0A428QY91_9HYPO|nr:hypothetical protein CEP54_001804 [Fusarium duplospermum]
MTTTNNGIDIIGDCVRLVNEALPLMPLTHAGYPYVEVLVCGSVILRQENMPHVFLVASSKAGFTVYVNMDLPGIKRTLKELAESGAPWTEFQAVRYEFVTIDLNPTVPVPTIPVSTVPNSITFPNGVSIDDSFPQGFPEQE